MPDKEIVKEEVLEEELSEEDLLALQDFIKEFSEPVMVLDIEHELEENEKAEQQFQDGIDDAMYYAGFYTTLASAGVEKEILHDIIVLKAGYRMNGATKKDKDEIRKEIIEKEFENF